MSENINGWLYDACSGVCAGVASYEQAEAWKASGGRPIRTTYAGCPVQYIIRARTDIVSVNGLCGDVGP